MEIRFENETCEICGRRFSEFQHSAFRKSYKCPNCEKIVCGMCLFEHKCGRRLCTSCIASRLRWRKEITELGPDNEVWKNKFEVWKHPWGAPTCGVCGKTDWWYRVADIIAINL